MASNYMKTGKRSNYYAKIFFIIFIIAIIFTLIYYIYKSQKTKENFGIYCGSYNLNKATAQRYCSSDPECAWNSTKDPNTGLMNNWCSQNPNGVSPTQTLPQKLQIFNENISQLLS